MEREETQKKYTHNVFSHIYDIKSPVFFGFKPNKFVILALK